MKNWYSRRAAFFQMNSEEGSVPEESSFPNDVEVPLPMDTVVRA
jgi:hypothetical protein